ncbi:ferritin-like domain-containing protein [Maribacter stanieri]|jgi:bacterioferritin|uniref:ferritin-like domain-containing protein n=2 Tax=Maribacter TaxID=252356 RepID=UPI0030DBDABE
MFIYKYVIMENKTILLNGLQEMLSATFAGAEQHLVHATINEYNGFPKLAQRMRSEFEDEISDTKILMSRILDLGGTPNTKHQTLPIHLDVAKQLEQELTEQLIAIKRLEELIALSENDGATRMVFEDFLKDEDLHTRWLKQQISLMKNVGVANYLTTQI